MVGSTYNVSRFKPALNLNRVLADFGGFKPRLKFFKFHLRTCLFINEGLIDITSTVPFRIHLAKMPYIDKKV